MKRRHRRHINQYFEAENTRKKNALLKKQREFEEKRLLLTEKTFVYHDDFKLGIIVSSQQDSLEIHFARKKENHTMSMRIAVKSLKILPKSHILVLKACVPDKLRSKVYADPSWAFRILIKSYEGSITLADVRKELDGKIVKNYRQWIQKALKKIGNDPHFIQIVKNGRIAYTYVEEPINKKDLSVDLKIIPPNLMIHIRPNNFPCINRNHVLYPFYTYIPVQMDRGIKTVKTYVDYCKNCRKFFISDIEFDSKFHGETGRLLRSFTSPDGQLFGPQYGTGMNIMSDESPLRKAGYTVSKQEGLSSLERQSILDDVILFGIMDVPMVKTYLQFYIDYLGKNDNMEDAVGSWIMDLNYINQNYSKPLDVFFN